MANRIDRPNFDFSQKTSALGSLFLDHQRQRDHNRDWSADTCQLTESVWVWFGPALDQFDHDFLKFRAGKRAMNPEERKAAEKQIIVALRHRLYELQAARQKAVGKPYSPFSVNMFVR
jgi:hypothetical protein